MLQRMMRSSPAASAQASLTVLPAATPMAFVRAIVRAYERAGADPAATLKLAGITPAQLARPAARITAAQMETLCSTAMQELDDEALGWFTRRLPWGSYGMLSRASLTAPSLGVALKRWCRHHRLLTDDITIALTLAGPVATISVEEHRPLGDMREMREFCLVTTLRNVHGYACWTIDSRIPLLQASFPFAAPPHHEAYPLMFRGPLSFDAGRAAISFDARYLALPLRRDERALQTMLRRALPLIVLQYRRDRLLVPQVQALLRDRPADAVNADTVAQALHVSVRTLHRQLQEEGASLQSLKDSVRREQAIEHLCRSARPIKQIAMAVGFTSEKSFARAFRQWTGDSPSGFRQRSRGA
ncbi:AraC family transcriptional regulator [soil metagenome]